jgi:hypothetical protein
MLMVALASLVVFTTARALWAVAFTLIHLRSELGDGCVD